MLNDDQKRAWGFHPMQDAYFQTLREDNEYLVPARVIFSSHDHYKVLIPGAESELLARMRGHLYKEGEELPVVGDWVVIEYVPGDHQYVPIAGLLPRLTTLRRADAQMGTQTLIANVDVVGVVTSFNRDFNERRLERGVAMAREGGARPIVVVNKADLIDIRAAQDQLASLERRFGDTPVIACSAQSGYGLERIKSLLPPGSSVAFLGMSGVGKSTLINAIAERNLETRAIRAKDDRGRHTTTHREVVRTREGLWIIDTPGVREFSFAGDESDLVESFADISALMEKCRFGNCSHQGEPGCRVADALERGELARDRWENYLKIRREIEFHARKHDKAYRSERRKEYVKVAIGFRKRLKAKGKRKR